MRQPCHAVRVLPVLHTIPISHYGERARWALDHAGLEYEERHHLQMFSWLVARRHSGNKVLPVLVTDGGMVADSAAIARWASDRAASPLYPCDEVLERELADSYGVETRRLAYDWLFRSMRSGLAYNAGRAPVYQVAAMRLAQRAARGFATRYLRVHDAELARGKDTVMRMLDRIAARLADGRRYLDGDRFTGLDLTFAAMTAPLILPERYGVTLPGPAMLPADAGELVARYRAHPAGAFAVRLYDARPAPRGRYARPLRVGRLPV